MENIKNSVDLTRLGQLDQCLSPFEKMLDELNLGPFCTYELCSRWKGDQPRQPQIFLAKQLAKVSAAYLEKYESQADNLSKTISEKVSPQNGENIEIQHKDHSNDLIDLGQQKLNTMIEKFQSKMEKEYK